MAGYSRGGERLGLIMVVLLVGSYIFRRYSRYVVVIVLDRLACEKAGKEEGESGCSGQTPLID